jgi:hypothetical protein
MAWRLDEELDANKSFPAFVGLVDAFARKPAEKCSLFKPAELGTARVFNDLCLKA